MTKNVIDDKSVLDHKLLRNLYSKLWVNKFWALDEKKPSTKECGRCGKPVKTFVNKPIHASCLDM